MTDDISAGIEAAKNGNYDELIKLHNEKFSVKYLSKVLEHFDDPELFRNIFDNYPDQVIYLLIYALRCETTYYLDFICEHYDPENFCTIFCNLINCSSCELPRMANNIDRILNNFTNDKQRKKCLETIMKINSHEGYFRKLSVDHRDIIDKEIIASVIDGGIMSAEKIECLFENNYFDSYPQLVRKLLGKLFRDSNLDLTKIVMRYCTHSLKLEINLSPYLFMNDMSRFEEILEYLSQNGTVIRINESDDFKMMKRISEKYSLSFIDYIFRRNNPRNYSWSKSGSMMKIGKYPEIYYVTILNADH